MAAQPPQSTNPDHFTTIPVRVLRNKIQRFRREQWTVHRSFVSPFLKWIIHQFALNISIRDQSVLVNWIVPDSDPSHDFRSGKPLPFKHRTGTDDSFPFEKKTITSSHKNFCEQLKINSTSRTIDLVYVYIIILIDQKNELSKSQE